MSRIRTLNSLTSGCTPASSNCK
uniref:Uncharacterized protein n=1 Tax=Arundo donax TaxID=35708 RepID=A0A0A9FKY1_ARUDO